MTQTDPTTPRQDAELPNKHVPDHPDAYLNALLDYTKGFYSATREAGLPAKVCADAMQHVESAARGLHRKAMSAALSPAPEAGEGQVRQLKGCPRWDNAVGDFVYDEGSRPTPDKRDEVARHVYDAMRWAVRFAGECPAPEWVEGGNSDAQQQARKQALSILAAVSSTRTPETQGGTGEAVVKRTMTINLTDREMVALEEVMRAKDLSAPAVFRNSFRLYQLVEKGGASIIHHDSGPLGQDQVQAVRAQPPRASGGEVEKVAAIIDPDVWAETLPVPTRSDLIDFHARRQSSAALATRILSALQAHPGEVVGLQEGSKS